MNLGQIGKFMLAAVAFQLLSLNCSSPERTDTNLNGKTIEIVNQKLGSPDSINEFILTRRLYEYQYKLLHYYPEPEGKNILIKETVWNRGKTKTVVWFKKVEENWISIDNLTWNTDKIKY
jgi:hypothetical protein